MIREGIEALVDYLAPPKVIDHPVGVRKYLVTAKGATVKMLGAETAHRRLYDFADLTSYVDWLVAAHHDEPGDPVEQVTTIEVIVDDTACHAAINPVDPHADELTCRLVYLPEFRQWLDLFNTGGVSHRAFYLALVALQDTIKNGDVITQSVGSLKLVKGGELNLKIDRAGMYRVRSKSETNELEVAIPSEFMIDVPVYRGLQDADGEETTIEMMVLLTINVDEDDDEPTFTVSCPALDRYLEGARQAVVEQIHRAIPGRLVGRGTFKTATYVVGGG